MFGLKVYNVIIAILILYSFIPYEPGIRLALTRPFGVPSTYFPFLIIFFLLFLKETVYSLLKHDFFMHKSVILFTVFILYIPIQLLLLLRNQEIVMGDYLLDYAMYLFYGFAVFYGTSLYFYNKRDGLSELNNTAEGFMKMLLVVCLISPFRYFLFDLGHAPFYNLFNPLRYRLFEILFLVFFATLAIGWYSSTRNQRYMVYFAVYSFNIILTGSRTGYIIFALLLLYFLFRENRRLFVSFRGVLVTTAVIAGFVVGGETVTRRMIKIGDVTLFATADIERAVKLDTSVRRVTFLTSSMEIAREHPLLGVGLGKKNLEMKFPYYLLRYAHRVARPHNFYLNLLVSGGLIGLFLFCLFMLSILRYGYSSFKLKGLSPYMREKNIHFILANILILIMQLGYEFETEPFIWLFWGMSLSFFYHTRLHVGLENARGVRLC